MKKYIPLALFGLLCLGASAFGFYSSAGKSFSLDETDLATRAHMINAAGPRGPELYYGQGNGEAVPHPPMYDYALALVFRLFGETEIAARSFGVFCFILVGILTALSVGEFLKNEDRKQRNLAVFFGVCLYLVNPLLIQHSMLIDADAAFTFLFLNLFAYVYIRFENRSPSPPAGRYLILAGLFALVCLSKEGTPFLAAAGAAGYRVLGRQWKKMLTEFLFIFVLGAVFAWGAWLLFCHATGIDAMIFLRQQYAFRVSRPGTWEFFMRVLKNIPLILRWPVFWVSPAFFVLLFLCLARNAGEFMKNKKWELCDFYFLTGLAVWVPYFFVKPSVDMMKYQHPVYPLFIAAMAAVFSRVFKKKEPPPVFFILLAAAACFYYYKLGDPLLLLMYPEKNTGWFEFLARYGWPMVAAAAAALAYRLFRGKSLWEGIAFASVFFIFPVNIALDIRQTEPYTTAESWLNYGEKGLKETVDHLARRIHGEAPSVLRKDLVYYLQFRRGVSVSKNRNPNYLLRDQPLPEAVRDYLAQPSEYVVLDRVVITSNPLLKIVGKKIFANYALEKKFGNFSVLRLKEKI